MLKDLFDKFKKDNKEKDPINLNIFDGFVDIKGYKVVDGKKKLVYHDCGDNVVTDWMRHAIMVMLTGSVFSQNGNSSLENATEAGSRSSSVSFSMLGQTNQYHSSKSEGSSGKNLDGYVLNGSQYFFDASAITEKYSKSTMADNIYALFPTKVLFGTGKEYASFDALSAENSVVNQNWYNDIVSEYGGIQNASATFDGNISFNNNKFSGTIANN
ncbi:hypothetical protein, partial [Ruminococcus sp.]|uniref:hypothetical protein n=1 Tax=Ruminococcus sp. TaxID=41978 RepID=UPI002E81F284